MTESTDYYGKYRGVVINNIDPMQMGRIQVQVPDVLGPALSSWAMPCVPFAGIQSGVFVQPQIGAGVWVGFEQVSCAGGVKATSGAAISSMTRARSVAEQPLAVLVSSSW